VSAVRWNNLMLGVLPIEAAVLWVIFWPMLHRDWTLIFPPLVATAAAVTYWFAWTVVYRSRRRPARGKGGSR